MGTAEHPCGHETPPVGQVGFGLDVNAIANE